MLKLDNKQQLLFNVLAKDDETQFQLLTDTVKSSRFRITRTKDENNNDVETLMATIESDKV